MIPSVRSGPRAPVRPHLLGEDLPHLACADLVALPLRQRAPLGVSQMRELAEYQELVEGIYTQATDEFQTHREPEPTQIVHSLVERQAAREPQRPVRPPELVLDNIPGVPQQHPPGLL